MKTSGALLLALALLLPAPSALAADSLLKKAAYCRDLEENQEPKNPAESFQPDEKICLSIELKGRPKSGIATARFFFRDDLIVEAKVDVAEANKGVIFSFGQNTFVGFRLKPNAPLPVGEGYRTEVAFDGKPLGIFPFRVDPPKGAIPSKVASAVLARDVDDKSAPVEETREFAAPDKVVLAGRGDFGLGTWLEANWIVAGKIDPAGTKSFTLEENKKDVPFYFSFVPKGGWPAGEHAVTVLMNGKEAAREKFSVKAAPAMKASKIAVTKTVLFHDDGKGGAGEETGSFTPDDRKLHVEFVLAGPARVQGARIAWTLVQAGDMKNQEIAVAAIEDEGAQKVLTGSLSIKRALPTGTYRVDLLKEGTALATREFSVKTSSSEPPAGGGLRPRKK